MTLIGYELAETFGKHLVSLYEYGTVRYSLEVNSAPPLMVIIVAFILLIIGGLLYCKLRWKAMMIGVLLMILASSISMNLPSTAITNMFEVIFIFSLFLTQVYIMKIKK